MDLATATATELTEELRNSTVSSRELLDAMLARVEQFNPSFNAVVALDVDRARAAADAADQLTARGESTGPLHGLPMTIKDVFETEGLVTTSGAPELADHVPTTDASPVAKLKAAGAIVFGKTNVPLYAGDWQTFNEVYGRTNNAWDPTRTAGGSSGGAAVAISSGMTALELGSDIGGSIRIPSHYNGVYGFKPTWGVVDGRGHIPPPPGSLSVADVGVFGPMGRSVADLQLGFGIVAGPSVEDAVGWQLTLDAGPPVETVSGLRVATVFDAGNDLHPLAADMRANLAAFADRLSDAGAEVDAVPLPVSLTDGLVAWLQLVVPIIGSALPDDVYDAFRALDTIEGDDLGLISGRAMAARYRDWARADGRRQHQRQAWARLFEDYDVVLAPTMPTAAIPHDTERTMVERTVDVDGTEVSHLIAVAWVGAIGSVLLPVVDLPTGLTPSGLPVGVQVVGPYLSDLRLLRLAALIDRAAGSGFLAPPSVRVS